MPVIQAINNMKVSRMNLGANERSTIIPERIVQARKRRQMQKMISLIFVPLCMIGEQKKLRLFKEGNNGASAFTRNRRNIR
jgi:hypothetical protein